MTYDEIKINLNLNLTVTNTFILAGGNVAV